MNEREPGYYQDPFEPEVYRAWDGRAWTLNVVLGATDTPVQSAGPHVGQSEPTPGARLYMPAERAVDLSGNVREAGVDQKGASGVKVVAVLWAIIAAIVGANFILGTESLQYGGDAYTGIQNAAAHTARAVGWLIVSTGPLGLIIAFSRRS